MQLPEENHVARYCAPRTVQAGVIGTSAFAFRRTEVDGAVQFKEPSLSVDWLELITRPETGETEELLQALRVFYGTTHPFDKMQLRPSGMFAVLPVNAIHSEVVAEITTLTCTHAPRIDGHDDCHALVTPNPGVDAWSPADDDPAHLAVQQALLKMVIRAEAVGKPPVAT